MDAIENILSRKSVREFSDKEISEIWQKSLTHQITFCRDVNLLNIMPCQPGALFIKNSVLVPDLLE